MISAASRTAPKPKNLVQSIERASILLDALSRYPQGLSLGDLASEVDLNKGTVHRILTSLVYLGYARHDPATRNYSLGFKLAELGNLLLSQLDLRNVARSHLIELAERVQETVHLVIRDYDEALYIDKVDLHPKQAGLQMVSRLGSRILLHCCSVGKVLLAHLPDDTVDEIIRNKGLPARTEHTITDPGRLKAHLQNVRKQGYAVDDEENERGIRCVAAPVMNGSRKVVAAISISGPAARMTIDLVNGSLKEQVRGAAAAISKELGFRWEARAHGRDHCTN
jgi:IclR family KDG regulon transcriptional repressor